MGIPDHHLELIELLRVTKQSEMYARVFQRIEEDHEDTLPVFKRCLTTGSKQSQEMVSKFICALVNDIHWSYDTPKNEESWYPQSHSRLLSIWNPLNVLEECGIHYLDKDVDEDNDILMQTSLIEAVYPDLSREVLNYPLKDEHWRGLAVMALSNIRPVMTDAETNFLPGYVAWAGSHSDAPSVIDVTRERGTYKVEALITVLEQRSDTARSLTRGLL